MNLKREYYQRPRTSDKNIATIKNVVKLCLIIYQNKQEFPKQKAFNNHKPRTWAEYCYVIVES